MTVTKQRNSEARVVVVFGGPSPEHEVSLASARGVLEGADKLGWDVLPVGVGKDGVWHVGTGALGRLLKDADHSRIPGGASFDTFDGLATPYDHIPPIDTFDGYSHALSVAHGRWGEDGTLQVLLGGLGLRLIGCGPESSALCMDKASTKAVLASTGIPVTRGTVVDPAADFLDLASGVSAEVGPPPWFVKPRAGGSSIGISKVRSPGQLAAAVERATIDDADVLVEELVPHRELVVGIVGRKSLVVSPPGKCRPVGDLYTYEEKYKVGNPLFTCPADIGEQLSDAAQDLAVAAYRAMGCDVFARVDLFIDERTGGLLVNEVNTIPGMTSTSVFPKLMRAAGLEYPNLLHAMLTAAVE